jgi:hypothetical protein
MEGAGVWCAMANQAGGRPAAALQRPGARRSSVVKPTWSIRRQAELILAPIEESRECLKIPVRADGSEYFLLENRAKEGGSTPACRPRGC